MSAVKNIQYKIQDIASIKFIPFEEIGKCENGLNIWNWFSENKIFDYSYFAILATKKIDIVGSVTVHPKKCEGKLIIAQVKHIQITFRFSVKNFFSKCDHSFLRIWSHLLKKSLMENLMLLCSV